MARRAPRLLGGVAALALCVGGRSPGPLEAGLATDPHGARPRPHAEGAPLGHTGGFGEPTCRACHDEFELGAYGRLSVEGVPGRYVPGKSYTVTLVLESAGMERAGFQATVRTAEGAQAGQLAAVDPSVVPLRDAETGVVYLQHAPGALSTGGRELAGWAFTWTAPETAVGPVLFHGARGTDPRRARARALLAGSDPAVPHRQGGQPQPFRSRNRVMCAVWCRACQA